MLALLKIVIVLLIVAASEAHPHSPDYGPHASDQNQASVPIASSNGYYQSPAKMPVSQDENQALKSSNINGYGESPVPIDVVTVQTEATGKQDQRHGDPAIAQSNNGYGPFPVAVDVATEQTEATTKKDATKAAELPTEKANNNYYAGAQTEKVQTTTAVVQSEARTTEEETETTEQMQTTAQESKTIAKEDILTTAEPEGTTADNQYLAAVKKDEKSEIVGEVDVALSINEPEAPQSNNQLFGLEFIEQLKDEFLLSLRDEIARIMKTGIFGNAFHQIGEADEKEMTVFENESNVTEMMEISEKIEDKTIVAAPIVPNNNKTFETKTSATPEEQPSTTKTMKKVMHQKKHEGVDKFGFCCYWAGNGECDKNQFLMRAYCQKSCGTPYCTVYNATLCNVKVNTENCPYDLKSRTVFNKDKNTDTFPQPKALLETLSAQLQLKLKKQEAENELAATNTQTTEKDTKETTTTKTSQATTSSSATTDSTTAPSTTVGHGIDNYEFCCFWAGNGECDNNPKTMRVQCQKSCGTHYCTAANATVCNVTVNTEDCPFVLNIREELEKLDITTTESVNISSPSDQTNETAEILEVTMPSEATTEKTSTTTSQLNDEKLTKGETELGAVKKTVESEFVAPIDIPYEGQDLHSYCCYWAVNGECDTNVIMMRPQCQKSCGTPYCTRQNATLCEVKINIENCPFDLDSKTFFNEQEEVELTTQASEDAQSTTEEAFPTPNIKFFRAL